MSDGGQDDIVKFSSDASTASTFTLHTDGSLTTLNGHLGQVEVSNISGGAVNSELYFNTYGQVAQYGYADSQCTLTGGEGGELQCVTQANVRFYVCGDGSLRVGVTIPGGCEAVSLTAFNVGSA